MGLRTKSVSIFLLIIAPVLCVAAKSANAQINITLPLNPATTRHRTVPMSTEYGSIFAQPDGFPISDFGIYIGATKNSVKLNPDAIKGHYSHFNHFGPGDEGIGFPYTELRDYEASEVQAGRPPIFVTATYQGKKRPVLFQGYLHLDATGKPTAPESEWVYAVNTQDARFINFWITKYARPVVLEPMANLKNAWVYLDGCQFDYTVYGVLDDNGYFVPGIAWDAPFPSNAVDYLKSITFFFDHVKQSAPDINMMADTGGLSDPTRFSRIYANVPGLLTENIYGWATSPDPVTLTALYQHIIPWFSWASRQEKVTVFGAFLPSNYEDGPLLTSFVFYEILKGFNSFFAPRVGGTALPESAGWLGWTAKLGDPVSAFQSKQQPGAQPGNRLFWRVYTNGYVYLNWTGITQTVILPTGSWFDPQGNQVSTLTIPTWTGSFVNK